MNFPFLSDDEIIAVVGIGCRFPRAIRGAKAYWQFLADGQTAIDELPASRFGVKAIYDENPDALGRANTKWGAFLDDVRGFDAAFFEISPREASSMDPQQRLLLEVVEDAFEDAYLTRQDVQNVRTGVFVGISASDYGNLQRYQHTRSDVYAGTGSALSIAANRISHRFNLNGPSSSVDTACSSSLVALDQAVVSLRAGRCDIALAGGVNVLTDPAAFIAFSKAGMLSPTGRISTFDQRANGYVRGEGAGVVVLKRLSDARAAGDRIYALLRATSVNQDGRTTTLTAPSEAAQREMLQELCRRAGVAPESVDYVEAHGTGTPVGDPIEASAIGSVFGQARDGDPVLVGSVKPNIGHLESAAGISGFIKTVLIAHHRVVPPNINFATPNPNIPFDALNIRVPGEMTPIAGDGRGPLVVVNSFGFGGTNASALLEGIPAPEYVSHAATAADPPHAIVIPLSAASEASLRAGAAALADGLEGELSDRPIADLAASLGRFRSIGTRRAAVIATNRDDAIARLRELADDNVVPLPRGQLPVHVSGSTRPHHRIAFTFAGQGGQWWKMARRLIGEDEAFSRVFNRFDSLFADMSGWSIKAEILKDEAEATLGRSLVAQPGIFGVEIGLAAAWAARGVTPDVVVGHSFGEASAAYVAGILDLEQATRLISVRAQMHDHVPKGGAMIAVGLSADAAMALVGDTGVDLAAYNTRDTTTLTGPGEAIEAAYAAIASAAPDVLLRRLDTDTAWHSRGLRVAEDWFRGALGQIAYKPGKIAFASTVTGKLESRFDLDYWWQNLCQPVSYYPAVELALELGANTFIELSPSRVLSGPNSRIAAERGKKVTIVNSLQRDADDFHGLAVAAAELHCAGVALDWEGVTGGSAVKSGLPAYAWDRQEFWHESEEARELLFAPRAHPLLGKRRPGPGFVWTNEFNLTSERYLAGHGIEGDTIFPAAGYLEIMLAAGRDALQDGVIELNDVEFLAALFIAPDDDVLLSTTYDERSGLIEIASRVRDEAPSWIPRARGRMRLTDALPLAQGPTPESVEHTVEKAAFYEKTAFHGLSYAGPFQSVVSVAVSGATAVSEIAMPEDAKPGSERYLAHPGPLDSALQTIVVLATQYSERDAYPLYLPVGVRRMRLAGVLPPRFTAVARLERGASGGLSADYVMLDEAGQPLVAIDGMGLRKANSRREEAAEEVSAHHLVEAFVETALQPAEPKALAGSEWGVVAESAAAARPVIAAFEAAGAAAEWIALDPFLDFDHLAEVGSDAAWGDGRGGFVFAAPYLLDGLDETASGRDVAAAVERLTTALIGIGRTVNALNGETRRPEIVVLTRGARSVASAPISSVPALVGSAMAGLVRTVSNECPDNAVVAIDCDDDSALAQIAALLTDGRGETEWALRSGAAYVPRLRTIAAAQLPRQRIKADPAGEVNFELTMQAPGSINGLVLEQAPMPAPAAGQVLLKTLAVGLNFRDVMAATGLLPAEAEPDPAWLKLGLEYSAEVVAIGEGVTGLLPGDRVMGMGRGCLRAFATAPASSVVKLPSRIGNDAAATVPSAFATAWYALNHVGRVLPGERVLIHLGTGGVGLAAIQIARNAGAEILATAGSESKRDYLRALGIKHVMHSRSLSFFDDVMAATNGEGVDVVLNALPTAYIESGVRLLRPFGRFLEIGKRDVYADTPIGMHALRRNISFSVIDLAAMANDKPALLAAVFQQVVDELAAGRLEPLPLTRFPVDRSAEAFRLMSQAKHIGKVVIGFGDAPVSVAASAGQSFSARSDGNYLITGGSRGFGISVAEWLSVNGAGEVTLVSRSGAVDPELAPRLEAIRARGTIVTSRGLDVADGAAVEALVADLAVRGRRLAGIVHGAAVIRDAFIGQLDRETIAAVIEPKVAGAWNLHRALQQAGIAVDFFVSFSSIAQVIGSVGQANYVSANAFLDGFASYRQAGGQAGLTIDWGALADAGFVARNDALARYLDSMGMAPIADAEAFAGLGQSLASDIASVAYARIDWPRMTRALGAKGGAPRLADVSSGKREGTHQIQAELAASAQSEWPAIVETFVITEVATVLAADAAELAPTRALTELGFDSLSSIELKNRLESQLALSFTVGAFLQAKTLKDLSQLIFELLVQKAKSAAAADAAEAATGAEKSAERDGFAPAADQLRSLALTTGAMTSLDGRLALESAGTARLDGVTEQSALAAWAALCARHPLLSVAYRDGGVSLDAPPAAASVGDVPAAIVPPLAVEAGELVRAVIAADPSGTTLGLKLHAAVADGAGLKLALDEWQALARGAALAAAPAPSATFAELRNRRTDAEGDRAKSNIAYWRAAMLPWVKAANLPQRRLALAPVGLGLNRGATSRLTMTILNAPGSSGGGIEARLLAAFALALARETKSASILIERHDPTPAPIASSIGPWARSVPVVLRDSTVPFATAAQRVARQLEYATAHADFSLAAIESQFGDDIRAAGAVPGQFGFSFGSDGRAAAYIAHDVHLVVAGAGSSLEIELLFDTAVVDDEWAERLLATTASLAAEGTAIAASPSPQRKHVNGHANGGAPHVKGASKASVIPANGAAPHPAPALQPISNGTTFPVLGSTRAMMALLQRKEATRTFIGNWNVNQALLIRPGIDVHRMSAALASLVHRHETLRTRFLVRGGDLQAVVEPRYPGKLTLHDLGDVSREVMLDAVNTIAARPFDLEQGPLFEVHVFKCGKKGDVALIHLCEFVADGWSMSLIIDELVRHYVGLGAPPGNGTRYGDVLALTAPPTDHAERAALDAYWRSVMAPLAPQPVFGRVAKGYPAAEPGMQAPYQRLSLEINRAGLGRLTKRAAALNVSENALWAAAIMGTATRAAGAETSYFSAIHPMRNAAGLRDKVAMLMGRLPVRCDIAEAGSFDALARQIHDRLTANNAHAYSGLEIDAPASMPDGSPSAQQAWPQWAYGRLLPENVLKSSMAAPLIGSTRGAKVRILTYEFEALPMQPYGFTQGDFVFRPLTTPDGIEVSFFYDLLSLKEEEAAGLLAGALDDLGLEPRHLGERGVSSIMGHSEDLDRLRQGLAPEPYRFKSSVG